MELTEKILELKGCPLHYWEGGQTQQPLVVFLHGACVDHHSFDLILPEFGEKYHIVTMDNRGHGRSQPMGEVYTTPLAMEDTLAVMRRCGYEKAVFVGHSNGTYIAQEAAFRHPEVVSALVILDGTCITWEHSAFEKFLVDASPLLFNLYPYETLKKASLPYASDRPDVQRYNYDAYSMLSKKDFITIWTGITRCLHSEPGYRIQQPMLLMHGEHDKMGDIKKIASKWSAREPHCRYVVIPNANHFSVLEEPDFINEKILTFLAQLPEGQL